MASTVEPSKRRKTPWIMGATVLLLFTLLIILQSSNLWKDLTVRTSSDLVLLYGLSALNFFAFIVFGFIFLRSIIKLMRERRTFELGSQIKTRLLLYFFVVSLLPIFAMAIFSYLFMNRALERWFTQIPETVMRETREIQRRSIADRFLRLDESTRMMASLIDSTKVTDVDLERISAAGNLTFIAIQRADGRVAALYERPLSTAQKSILDRLLNETRMGQTDVPASRDGREYDLARVTMPNGADLIVVPDIYSEESVSQIVDNSLVEFDLLKDKQITIRQVGLLTLGVLTFLLIFASMWIAFYVARGLTAPIKALAIGADEIARGNLGHRVDVLAEDELAKLVDAFNEMSATLEQNSGEITERRRYIETVLETLPTGVISFNEENRISTINRAASEMLRLDRVDVPGNRITELLNESNSTIIERLLNRARRTGHASEQAIFRPEIAEAADELSVSITVSSLPDGKGAVLVLEDLSELIAAQRSSAWQEVARRMAHEIKNPLTPIQLSAERIAKRFENSGHVENGTGKRINDKGALQDVVHESTATILREVSSLKTMVDEFSRFARLPEVELESGDVSDIIRQSVATFDGKFENITIEFAENGDLPAVMLDPEQLKRVFTNLIENACEAMDGNRSDGKVTITARHDTARDIVVSDVSDNGKGIEPRDLQKLFQPYFSTKGRGTGLGLAIVNRIISEHHGKINVAANQLTGARFIIELPITA